MNYFKLWLFYLLCFTGIYKSIPNDSSINRQDFTTTNCIYFPRYYKEPFSLPKLSHGAVRKTGKHQHRRFVNQRYRSTENLGNRQSCRRTSQRRTKIWQESTWIWTRTDPEQTVRTGHPNRLPKQEPKQTSQTDVPNRRPNRRPKQTSQTDVPIRSQSDQDVWCQESDTVHDHLQSLLWEEG